MKIKIQELSLDFQGDLDDLAVIQILAISRNTYYKYKKRIKEELNSGTNN
jgi:ACT domain-containing protein